MAGPSDRGAALSACLTYRYVLWRTWGPAPYVAYYGLNPSTADAEVDDHTVNRWRYYAKRDGFGGFVALNLFALRSTDPKRLLTHADPVGPTTDAIAKMWLDLPEVTRVVACWGAHKLASARREAVLAMLRPREDRLHCFGLTQGGFPKHPARLANAVPVVPWRP
jgi:hypothetical protein